MKVSAGDLTMGELPDGTVPLGAVTALKVMYPNGQIGYLIRVSEDLPLVEALGMARHAVLIVEDTIMHPSE